MTFILPQNISLRTGQGQKTFTVRETELGFSHQALQGLEARDFFVGQSRIQQLQAMQKSWRATRGGQAHILSGNRQAGKTSSFHYLLETLRQDPEGPIGLYLNGGAYSPDMLFEDISESLSRPRSRARLCSHPDALAGISFDTESSFYTAITKVHEDTGKAVILMIDEGSNLLQHHPNFLRLWRNRCSDVGVPVYMLVLSFLEDIYYQLAERKYMNAAGANTSSSLNNASRDYLAAFDGQDVADLLFQRLFHERIRITEELKAFYTVASSGNPMMAARIAEFQIAQWQGRRLPADALAVFPDPQSLLEDHTPLEDRLKHSAEFFHAMNTHAFASLCEAFYSELAGIKIGEVLKFAANLMTQSESLSVREGELLHQLKQKGLVSPESQEWLPKILDHFIGASTFFTRRFVADEPILTLNNLYLYLNADTGLSYEEKIERFLKY